MKTYAKRFNNYRSELEMSLMLDQLLNRNQRAQEAAWNAYEIARDNHRRLTAEAESRAAAKAYSPADAAYCTSLQPLGEGAVMVTFKQSNGVIEIAGVNLSDGFAGAHWFSAATVEQWRRLIATEFNIEPEL